MPVSRLEYLFNRYVQSSCSAKEEEELMELIAQSGNQESLKKLIDGLIENTGSEMELNDQVADSILKNILKKDEGLVIPVKTKNNGFRLWMRVAAMAILFLGAASAYWMINKKAGSQSQLVAGNKKHAAITPGGNKAILTTSDGGTIVLDSIQNGTITHKGATQISKQGGMLIYNVSSQTPAGTPVVYNTLTTPKGGQYQVVLPDGSKVWLNAASSLHFPSAFPGRDRVVELTGEAYFEVAKNKKKPFHVRVGNMSVNVLGTHFNVNAYADENAIKTSLLEGKVKIIRGNTSGILKPGQQGVLNNNEDKIEINNANLEEVMAWKNGIFQFEGAGITSIMKEIGRWYNVEIVYAGKIPVRRFEGKISRDSQLSEVLRILELSNIKFSVVGNNIIVQ